VKRLVVAVLLAVIAVAVALFFLVPWPDPNHQSAEDVVRHAGVPAGVTPGAAP
jgi:hypothetical protein